MKIDPSIKYVIYQVCRTKWHDIILQPSIGLPLYRCIRRELSPLFELLMFVGGGWMRFMAQGHVYMHSRFASWYVFCVACKFWNTNYGFQSIFHII